MANISKIEIGNKIYTLHDADAVADVQVGGTSVVDAQGIAKIISGTNIKTINGNSVLGAGDLEVGGGIASTITLDKDDWVNKTQTVTVSGMSTTKNIFVGPLLADTEAYEAAGILCTTQATNSLTFTCETVPTVDLRASLLILDTDSTLPAIPTNTSDLVNDGDGTSEFVTFDDLSDYNTFIATYGTTTYAEVSAALTSDKAIIIRDVPHNNDIIVMIVNWANDTGSAVEMEGIATVQGDMWDIDVSVSSSNEWSSTFVSRDPFMLLDFGQTIDVTIPSCQKDIANTSIPNVDVSITEAMGADWAIASLAKYEVKDSSGNRLNVWPVCMFSMNGQKTLRLRMMAAGPNDKAAASISGAILLKHR